MAIKICLDAGHYGKYNRSPVVPDYYESDMNWKLHLLLKSELESYGFQVITTRASKNKDLGLNARGRASKGCDLFLSLHSNAAGTESVDYPLAITMQDGKGDALGSKLAECIEATMGTKQDGTFWHKKGTNGGEWYSVLAGAASVGTMGMILEHSFHTNTAAAKWLLDDSNLDKLAKAEAKIIAEHFGVKKATQKGEVEVKVSVLKKGAKGAQVRALQALLIGYGYQMKSTSGTVYGVDGSFGGATERAVISYQVQHSLEADGSVGPKTWASLLGV